MSAEAALFGTDLFGEPIRPRASGPVAERFIFPPFTVLDAKTGDWQERKRAWLAMGIRSEVGRDAKAYNMGLKASAENGWAIEDDKGNGTSVFDPVVCEMAYRWWSPAGGTIVDPFAGGSVRGIVAAALGRHYWGCDLRAEQIDANIAQAADILGPAPVMPTWVCGDAMDVLADAPPADFVFSCPPYGDLEVYSDDPRDLSTMEWHTFTAAYRRIIHRAVGRLRDNRFACFVVGDFRDNRGFYRNFVSETIAAFELAGARLYNEAILATSVGSAAMRVTNQFNAGRKLCKTHQNILVFCKGDWRAAVAAINAGGEGNG
jgi:DNA modification methylase